MITASSSQPRELAVRENDGIEVQLLWNPADDTLTLRLDDAKMGVRFEVGVERDQALHAFRHPFMYADVATELDDADEAVTFEVGR